MAGVIEMSDRELTRLRVMIDLADGRPDAAATLMGLGRRQIYRLRRIFSADGFLLVRGFVTVLNNAQAWIAACGPHPPVSLPYSAR